MMDFLRTKKQLQLTGVIPVAQQIVVYRPPHRPAKHHLQQHRRQLQLM